VPAETPLALSNHRHREVDKGVARHRRASIENVLGEEAGTRTELEDARGRRVRLDDCSHEVVEDRRPPGTLAQSGVGPRGGLGLVVEVLAVRQVLLVVASHARSVWLTNVALSGEGQQQHCRMLPRISERP
jgi:hypothetical protein